jgi:hypothetical protein
MSTTAKKKTARTAAVNEMGHIVLDKLAIQVDGMDEEKQKAQRRKQLAAARVAEREGRCAAASTYHRHRGHQYGGQLYAGGRTRRYARRPVRHRRTHRARHRRTHRMRHRKRRGK